MSRIETPDKVTRIVGRDRHEIDHYGRAVSSEQRVYILHSKECIDTEPDLRRCPFSVLLDRGIDLTRWVEDQTVLLDVDAGRLVPAEEQPCIGGDYCGRMTNGWFEAGSHGPGYYCGWCEAVPA